MSSAPFPNGSTGFSPRRSSAMISAGCSSAATRHRSSIWRRASDSICPRRVQASRGSFDPTNRRIIAESPLSRVLSILPVGEKVTESNYRLVVASGTEIVWNGVDKSGRWLAVGSRVDDTHADSTVEIFDLASQDKKPTAKQSFPDILHAGWSPCGEWFIAAQGNHSVAVWRTTPDGMQPLGHAIKAREPVERVLISPDGKWLVAGTWGGLVRKKTLWLWRILPHGFAAEPRMLDESEDVISWVDWSPNGEWLAASVHGKSLRLWNLGSTSIRSFALPISDRVKSFDVRFSDDGRWALTTPHSAIPLLWDLRARVPADASHQLAGHEFPAVQASFTHDGRWLITADYAINETDARDGRSGSGI